MCMSNLYVVEFDNGDKMTGSISQVYAAQEVNGLRVVCSGAAVYGRVAADYRDISADA